MHNTISAVRVTIGILMLSAASTFAYAVPTGYTDPDAFLSALPGSANVVDFESAPAGTAIANGATFEGLTFQYDVLSGFGVELNIVDDFDTTSPANSLGTDDGGVLQHGDDVDISTSPVNAFGVTFILSDAPFDDEIRLTASGLTVSLVASQLVDTLDDGGLVYFLGLIDLDGTFTDAAITTSQCPGGCGYFLFNIDDVTTASAAVPEPSSWALLSIGLLILLRHRTKVLS